MLSVKNLICARNDHILFRNVGFELRAGQALQILGKNGVGKTTLLKTLAGLLRPAHGQITLPACALHYVGHKAGLHPDLSVWQNLLFLQALMPHLHADHATMLQALAFFNLTRSKDCKYGALSAGQAQQLLLVPLYFTLASLWLLDEPLAHLDSAANALLAQLCMQHLARGGILVFTTHQKLELSPYAVQTLALEQHV